MHAVEFLHSVVSLTLIAVDSISDFIYTAYAKTHF